MDSEPTKQETVERDQSQSSKMQLSIRRINPVAGVRKIVRLIAWKKISGVVLVLVAAMGAGYLGGQLGHDDTANTSTLTGQRQIVTSQGQLINKIAKDVSPSVVSVDVVTETSSSNIFGLSQPSRQRAAGTGIIISKDGTIMTNRHVVPAGTTEVSVTLSDGTQYDNVEVLGRTSSSDSLDVAFLKIKNLKGKALVPIAIGDSSKMQVGDTVVAIGNALGEFQNTVTSGIISGFGRQVQAGSDDGGLGAADAEDLGNLIQTDTAINEGNSGGPLVNLNGEIIGINTAIASNAENIGFAIPINDVKGLINQVLSTGSFARPYLGVRYITISAAVAKEYVLPVNDGAYLVPSGITGSDPVMPGSPAEKAGLRAGDIIIAVDGSKLSEQTSLTSLLNKHQPGDEVKLQVLRSGKTLTITATLGKVSGSN